MSDKEVILKLWDTILESKTIMNDYRVICEKQQRMISDMLVETKQYNDSVRKLLKDSE